MSEQKVAAEVVGSSAELGRLVERLLAYSDIRRNDQRESREALRDLLEDDLRALVAAERERCGRVCDDEARIRTEAAALHGAETPEWGRCMAAARAAINCAKGCRNGEEV